MDSKSSFGPLSSIVFILLLFPMSILYHLFRPQRAGELLVAIVPLRGDLIHSYEDGPTVISSSCPFLLCDLPAEPGGQSLGIEDRTAPDGFFDLGFGEDDGVYVLVRILVLGVRGFG